MYILLVAEDCLSKEGKIFESCIENSCKKQKIFYFRVRDVMIPPDLRTRIRVPKNRYDCLLFDRGYLFPLEFKSTKAKSISLKEEIIKAHQINSLLEATEYELTIPGFVFNFRSDESNFTCFIHIKDFVAYKEIAEGKRTDITYKSKINKSSIPIDICKEIGIEILNGKKKTNYFYDVKKLIDKLIQS